MATVNPTPTPTPTPTTPSVPNPTAVTIITNANTLGDRTLQETPTAPNQYSDYVAQYITYVMQLLGRDQLKRMHPGEIKFKDPNTITELLVKYNYIFDYG